ncbi:MAG TPA: glutathione S-transferase family protein [Terricaulis sp.]|nr:glutathione S-transferase family protein [Terricaulis sp.]
MADDVLIFTAATCGWAVRNYAVLYEKNVPFKAVDVKTSAAARAVFTSQFPYALTPGLQHGEVRVWESLLINEYLEEAFPHPPLLPDAVRPRARARQWLHHCDGVLFPALSGALRDSATAPKLQSALDQLSTPAFLAEAPAPFWSGAANLGLVDIAYHVFFKSLRTPGLEMIALPDWMRAWANAIAKAPSIERAEAFMASLRAPDAA